MATGIKPSKDFSEKDGSIDPSCLLAVKVCPKFLHSNSTSHTWVFSAIAELIDNACDTDVCARELWIDQESINDTPCLTFKDNGCGMTQDKLNKMLGFGFNEKEDVGKQLAIGKYGNGFKSGSMRLGQDALVITRGLQTASVGFLSQSYLNAINADTVLVPVVTWDITPVGLTRKRSIQNIHGLKAILDYSVFKSEGELTRQLDELGTRTGTKIIIYNLRKDSYGNLELDFMSDPVDIRNPETEALDPTVIYNRNRQAPAAITPEYRRSLREYCSILYLRPRMKISIRKKRVPTKLIEKSLRKTEEDVYNPQWANLRRGVKLTFGYTKDKSPDAPYGFMTYHNNRLIKAYERIGIQKKATGEGYGIIGVAEVNFLEPIHNKQDFRPTGQYNAFMNNAAKKLRDYYEEKTYTEGSSTGAVSQLEESWNWVQCDNCMSFRRLPGDFDVEKLPEKWYCKNNPDPLFNRCEIREELEGEDEGKVQPKPTYTKTVQKKKAEEKRLEKLEEERKAREKEEALNAAKETAAEEAKQKKEALKAARKKGKALKAVAEEAKRREEALNAERIRIREESLKKEATLRKSLNAAKETAAEEAKQKEEALKAAREKEKVLKAVAEEAKRREEALNAERIRISVESLKKEATLRKSLNAAKETAAEEAKQKEEALKAAGEKGKALKAVAEEAKRREEALKAERRIRQESLKKWATLRKSLNAAKETAAEEAKQKEEALKSAREKEKALKAVAEEAKRREEALNAERIRIREESLKKEATLRKSLNAAKETAAEEAKQKEEALKAAREKEKALKAVAEEAKRREEALNAERRRIREESLKKEATLRKEVEEQRRALEKQKKALDYMNPEIAAEERRMGNALFKQGKYSEALKHYNEAIKRNPKDAELHSNKAACYTKLQEFSRALAACDDCLYIDPKFIKGYLQRGIISNLMKNNKEAVKAYERALRFDPNCTEAIKGLQALQGDESSEGLAVCQFEPLNNLLDNTEVSPGKRKYPDRDGSDYRRTRQRTSKNGNQSVTKSFSNDKTPLQSRSCTISGTGYAELNQSPVYNGTPGLVSNTVHSTSEEKMLSELLVKTRELGELRRNVLTLLKILVFCFCFFGFFWFFCFGF
ncbi:MORC family CW-type zinc finger protein 3-like [Mercenaria mercenaria]|uniref:MORC family CW-type zinc finger protein 3-like n=1 Tax=Mercenaria mercenaria TaxID=6596 RepID=UPI00234F6ABA|nr:MORC family CW-type zinc finger protein 3-like [Mercenaria mercenaria]